MSKKLLVIFLSVLIAGFPIAAQESPFKPVANQTEIDAFKAALTQESNKMSNMKVDFVQTTNSSFLNEVVVSTGILYFAQGKRLRWEYEKPHSFVFILNGAKAWMVNQSGVTELHVAENKMFKELSELMLFGMGGGSLFENRNFDYSFWNSGAQWEVALKPKSKEMRAQYSQIELFFDAKSYQMKLVRMTDAAGDETLIQLNNPKINTQFSDALFDGKK